MNILYIFLFVSMLHIFFVSHSSEPDEQWWSGCSLLCTCKSMIPGQQLKLHRQLIWTCRKLVIEPWFCKLKINYLWSWDDDQHLGRGLQGSIVSKRASKALTAWNPLASIARCQRILSIDAKEFNNLSGWKLNTSINFAKTEEKCSLQCNGLWWQGHLLSLFHT
jgi:hypothetical protein